MSDKEEDRPKGCPQTGDLCSLYGTSDVVGNFNTRMQMAMLGQAHNAYQKRSQVVSVPESGVCLRYINCDNATGELDKDTRCNAAGLRIEGNGMRYPTWKTLDTKILYGVQSIDFVKRNCNVSE